MATNNIANVVTAIAGKALIGNGVGSPPTFTTAKYPLTAGTTGNVLVSDGTDWVSSPPSPSTGYVMSVWASPGNPTDLATYYLVTGQVLTTATAVNNGQRFPCPKSGTLTVAYGTIRALTPGSGESITIAVVINDVTTVNITTSAVASSAENTFNNTGLSQAITAGDWITFKVTGPTWATNPLNMSVSISLIII